MKRTKPRAPSLVRRLAPVAVLVCCAALAVMSSFRASITIDESAYLPRGLWIWHYGDFHLESQTTPLPSVLAALPVAVTERLRFSLAPATDPNTWTVAGQFMVDNAARYEHVFALARMVTILVFLGTCAVTWAFARSLYGTTAAFIALVSIAFEPNMLAHGTLVTADMYLAAGFVCTLWTFDAFLRKPGAWRSCALGAAIGVTVLCKLTGMLLMVLLPVSVLVMWAQRRLRFGGGGEPDAPRLTPALAIWSAVALGVAVVVINLGYANVWMAFKSAGDYEFATSTLSRVQAWFPAWLPVPLPVEFISGIDRQFNEGAYEAYLLGTFNTTGFWQYYIVGMLVKTPEPFILMAIASLLLWRRVSAREVPAIVVAVGAFGFVSFISHKNIGMRYVLFLLPLMAIGIGRLAAAPVWTSRRNVVRAAVTTGCVWLMLIAVSAWPNYLSYFNTASGGPGKGHTYLLDSNVDWGQDLITLRDYLRREGIDEIDLAYFGRVDPTLIYGIKFRPLWNSVGHRYVVISSNLLWGRRYWVYGTSNWMSNHDHYAPFRSRQPAAVLGGSLYVYDLGRP